MIGVTSAHAGGIFNKKTAQEEIKKESVQSAETNPVEYKTVRITGIVRLTGNEPFTELIIDGNYSSAAPHESIVWHIDRDERDLLYDMQYRTVTVEGDESVRELTFASGIPAGTRRELRNIRIISID